MPLYAVTIFVSAFLLFLVQPIVAKQILPWFGGSAAVWTTCVFFFQFLLLAGYAYAHAIVRWLPPRPQLALHLALLASASPACRSSPPPAGSRPETRIPACGSSGCWSPPSDCRTSCSPPRARWCRRGTRGGSTRRIACSRSRTSPRSRRCSATRSSSSRSSRPGCRRSPGRGPTPRSPCCAAVPRLQPAPGAPRPASAPLRLEPGPAPRPGVRLQWVALPALASLLLLAVTNHLTQNVASIPFLWVLPLSLYLLTFILCFDGRGWYRRVVFFLPLAGLAVAAMAWVLTDPNLILDLKLSIPLFAAGLFVLCMLCHGELVLMKPEPGASDRVLHADRARRRARVDAGVGDRAARAARRLRGRRSGSRLAAIVLAWKVAPAGRIALVGALAAVAFTVYGVVTYVTNTVADTRVHQAQLLLEPAHARRGAGGGHGAQADPRHHQPRRAVRRRRQAPAGRSRTSGPKSGIVLALEALRASRTCASASSVWAPARWRPTAARAMSTGSTRSIRRSSSSRRPNSRTCATATAKIELVLGDGRLALESEPPQRVRSPRRGRVLERLGADAPDHPRGAGAVHAPRPAGRRGRLQRHQPLSGSCAGGEAARRLARPARAAGEPQPRRRRVRHSTR